MKAYRELYKTACPLCKREGRDNASNNLSVNTNGAQYCWASHGFVVSPTRSNNHKPMFGTEERVTDDLSYKEKITGVSKITDKDVLRYLWKYSIIDPDRYGLKQVKDGRYTRVGGDRDRLLYVLLGLLIPVSGVGTNNFMVKQLNISTNYAKVINSKGSRWFDLLRDSSDYLVIVEDALSAIKVFESGFSALSLLGTSLKKETYSFLINYLKYNKWLKHIIIWLDGDEAGQEGARKLKQQLSIYGSVKNIVTAKDPKELSFNEIARRIYASNITT